MAKLILVVGGCRSGKSDYAQCVAQSLPPRRLYVATCPVVDPEIARRIEAHQLARSGRGWNTIEEQFDLAGALSDNRAYNVILADCVTLWVNNLMYRAGQQSREIAEEDIVQECGKVFEAVSRCHGTVVMVSNEVGMGVVPENAAARRYRDLVGRANQQIAARADVVTLVSCGIPLNLKEVRK